MGWKLRSWAVCAAMTVAMLCSAETPVERDIATIALDHGRLVIWIVHPASAKWKPEEQTAQSPISLPKTVQSATAGSFGTASSDVGQTAGSYGQTASSLGTASSNVGTASSNVGSGPATFGRAASDVGQTAGSYGQTAGSFGESLSTIAGAGETHPMASHLSEKHTADWDRVVFRLRTDFQGLEVVLKDVHEEDLAGELKRTAGSPDAPDVLLGSPLPWVWARSDGGKTSHWVLTGMGMAAFPVQFEDSRTQQIRYPRGPEMAILANAPHADRARAFAVWLSDGGLCRSCGQEPHPEAAVPASVAGAALKSVLAGGGVGGDADVDMAKSDADMVRRVALVSVIPPDGMKIRVDVVDAMANDRLAIVQLRAIASVEKAFGVLHALVVLRKDAGGKWKILQLTPNLSAAMQRDAAGILGEFCGGGSPAKVNGISQAAPPDGDVRSYRPDLWWDNLGGASMQIVEWQQGDGESWSGTRLYFVPDRDPHLRTRVTADFASDAGLYRWRVWSLGRGGVAVLSPWKTLSVMP